MNANPPSDHIGDLSHGSVPLIADSVPRDATGLARCVYFTIIADEPTTNWFLSIGSVAPLPFLMLGLQGIIFRPIRQDTFEFTRPGLLDEVIDAIEKLDGFSIETEYLWLPTKLLDSAFVAANASEFTQQRQADRGMVFRVSHRLFSDAVRAAQDGTQVAEFAKNASGQIVRDASNPQVRYSEVETKTIRLWSEQLAGASASFKR